MQLSICLILQHNPKIQCSQLEMPDKQDFRHHTEEAWEGLEW